MQALTANPGLLSPFHVAFPVHDLKQARAFYGGTLGCPAGRSCEEWVDFNFYGYQLVRSEAERDRAKEDAMRVRGVREVRNDIKVPG